MPFSSLSSEQPQPSRQAVLRALNIFMDQPRTALLKSKWDLLLTDSATQILTERIRQIEASSNPQNAITLKFYRWFLCRARQKEIEVACEELRYLTSSVERQSFSTLLECLFHSDAWRERRCLLEQHLELLDPALESALEVYTAMIVQNPEMMDGLGGDMASTAQGKRDVKRIGNDLSLLLEVLRDARRRGSTVTSVRDAYVNFFGGQALYAPPWLVEEEKKLLDLAGQEQREDRQAELLCDLIQRSQQDTQVAPETLAELRLQWAKMRFRSNSFKRDQEEYAEIIQLQKQALQIYTRKRYFYRFALAQKDMGNAYLQLAKGERKKHLETALRCYTKTLQVLTKEISPQLWAETYVDLAHTYLERLAGSKLKNIEKAIEAANTALQVFTRENYLAEWASAQHALANAYFYRIEGVKTDNLERAIMHYYAALQGIARDTHRHSWGLAHYSLGNSYNERIEGSHKENMEQAILHYHAALEVLTSEDFPLDWAMIQSGLGMAYLNRAEGIQKENIEQAIIYFHHALKVFTPETSPKELTAVYQNLGAAYWKRLDEARNENLEQAIVHYEQAEQICSRQKDSYRWAMLQYSLGNAYSDRLEGHRWENLQRAIRCYQAASQVWKRETFRREWALARHHLGTVYHQLQDEEQAIICYKDALKYFTYENHPYDWAGIQRNLGVAYSARTAGKRSINIQRAVNYVQTSLDQVFKLRAYPAEWASTQEALGTIYLKRPDKERLENMQAASSCYNAALKVYKEHGHLGRQRSVLLRLGNLEAEGARWNAAHTYFSEACQIEHDLSLLSAGAMGRDLIRSQTSEASTRDGYALIRLGCYQQAAIALEEGQARDLAEGLKLNNVDPEQITDENRRNRYIEAHKQLISAQSVLDRPFGLSAELSNTTANEAVLSEAVLREHRLEADKAHHQADRNFKAIVAEIQEAEDPKGFLEDRVEASSILNPAMSIGPRHALVYLVATPWGGFALVALDTGQSADQASCFFVIDLPRLTMSLMAELLKTKLQDGTNATVSSYIYAQQHNCISLFNRWFQQGETFRQATALLQKQCSACNQESTLARAAQDVLALPENASLVDIPLDLMDGKEQSLKMKPLFDQVNHAFLHYELQRCFEVLSTCALSPLMAELKAYDIASLTLIPCGWLAAFPVTAIPLADGSTIGETIPTSTVPSARSLRQEVKEHIPRSGIYALGNPEKNLRWGEEEVYTLFQLAQLLYQEGHFAVQNGVTRQKLVEALTRGLVVDISCHGSFDSEDFRRTQLHLAGKSLYLGDLLSHEVDLRGLRLLILSACQTAVLAPDGAVSEVRSLAAGVLQSGAQAVLASLWSVSELATYLLIVYFARQWLPRMEEMSPAEALAKAQKWLRNVTERALWEEMWQWDTVPTTAQEKDLESSDVHAIVRQRSIRQREDILPFESPVYWAGFQVTGW